MKEKRKKSIKMFGLRAEKYVYLYRINHKEKNLKNTNMYTQTINRRLKIARIAKRIVESALVLALARLAIEIVFIINN